MSMVPPFVNTEQLYHAYDGFTEGYARFRGDGTVDWYPGGSHVGCRRLASELDPIGPRYQPLHDEDFPAPDDDPCFDAVALYLASVLLDIQAALAWPLPERRLP